MENTQELYQLIRSNPVKFIELAFNEKLWDKQKDIVNSVRDNTYTAAKSCHGIGKSFISARIVLWFLYAFPNSKVITTAPTFRQVEDILWREIRVAKSKARILMNGTLNKTSLDISEDWFAMGLSTDEPTRFQGYHAEHIMLLIDEASGVKQDIFDASEGIVSSQGAKILYLGNPTDIEGEFFKSFRNPNVSKISINAFETPNFTEFGITIEDIRNNTWAEKITAPLPCPYLITPAWVYDKWLRWGEGSPMWSARIAGEFPEQGTDTLIPLARIEEARNRNIEVLDSDPEVIGADFAEFGSDKTEYCYRKGAKVRAWETQTHIDTITNAGKLKEFMDIHSFAQVNGDNGGLGIGIMDMVTANNPYKTVNKINNAAEPYDKESFVNLRAEMYWGLRDRFIDGTIDLSELPQLVYEDLAAQLSTIKYKFTPKGQRQIESKQDIRKRGLPSPDKADALVLAFGRAVEKPGIIEFMKEMYAE